MEKNNALMGPYRATRLWNDIITTFRTGMPMGKHRKNMRNYDDCFVASNAVSWLHDQLKRNPNFGPEVTRQSTIQLLQKFLKSKVFEDVRGAKHNKEEFEDNGRLYRFTATSPLRAVRTPLAARTDINNQRSSSEPRRFKMDFEKLKPVTCLPEAGLPECRLVSKTLSLSEIEEEWKSMLLNSLRRLLALQSLDGIVERNQVRAKNIMHNMTKVNKNGIVTDIPRVDQLPVWVLSAMRCLARWPNRVDEGLPNYPGFERDVFKVVRDYFEGLYEPLLTYSMYECFTNVIVRAENVEQQKREQQRMRMRAPSCTSLNSFASVENFILNLTAQGSDPDQQNNRDYENNYEYSRISSSCLNLSRITLVDDGRGLNRYTSTQSMNNQPHDTDPGYGSTQYSRNSGFKRSGSTRSITNSKVETAFSGPNNDTYTVYHPQSNQGLSSHGYYTQSSYGTEYSDGSKQQSSNNLYTSHKFASTMNIREEPHKNEDPLNLYNAHNKFYSTTNINDAAEFLGQQNYTKFQEVPRESTQRSSTFSLATNFGKSYAVTGSPEPMKSRYGSGVHLYDEPNKSRFSEPPKYQPPPSYDMVVFNKDGATYHPGQRTRSRNSSNNNSASTYYQTAKSQQSWGSTSDYETAYPSWNQDSASRSQHQSFQQERSGKTTNIDRELSGTNVHSNHLRRSSLPASRHYPVTSTTTDLLKPRIPQSQVPGSHVSETTQPSSDYGSNASLFMDGVQDRVKEALQLCCLMLPPANRRKLHLLLRLMSKMTTNQELHLDESTPTRTLVLQTFCRCILSSEEEADLDELLALRLVAFMMDNYEDIMSVPADLKKQVDDKIVHMRRAQPSPTSPKYVHIKYAMDDTSGVTYCEQVTREEYENQKLTTSQRALADLLDTIVADKNMAKKEKKKKLKQFQKTYPDIYAKRFPTSESEAALFPDKPKIKPPLLSKPLQRLRTLRM